MAIKNKLSVFLLAAVSLTSGAFADENCDTPLVVFGDSLSDTKNVFISQGGAFPPSPLYSNGRFTDSVSGPYPPGSLNNGSVWIEYLADLLGLDRPVARLTAGETPVDHETNYAFGGAVTGGNAVEFYPALLPTQKLTGGLPLDAQVDWFMQDFQDFALAPLNGCSPDPADALFLVWIGSNDVLLQAVAKPGIPVDNIKYNIQRLIDVGATWFLVPNIPNLASIPGVIGPYDSLFVSIETTYISLSEIEKRVRKFNSKLTEALDKIETKNPGVRIDRLDVFSLLTDVIDSPEEYGFDSETAIPALNEQALFIEMSTNPGELFRFDVHPVPYMSLFWDGAHPTSGMHAIVAEEACKVLDLPDINCSFPTQ